MVSHGHWNGQSAGWLVGRKSLDGLVGNGWSVWPIGLVCRSLSAQSVVSCVDWWVKRLVCRLVGWSSFAGWSIGQSDGRMVDQSVKYVALSRSVGLLERLTVVQTVRWSIGRSDGPPIKCAYADNIFCFSFVLSIDLVIIKTTDK